MQELERKMAERLKAASRVHVYAHIDSDGITGAAIASQALDRAGVDHGVSFLKKLDEAALRAIRAEHAPVTWFCDFGAGLYDRMDGLNAIITDHHVPVEREIPREARANLAAFAEAQDSVLMLNPHLLGEGSDAASGAGTTYLVAKAMDARNTDLAWIAFLLELGLEPKQEGRWIGWNGLSRDYKRLVLSELVRHMLDRGVSARDVERLVGETYTLLKEERGTPLRDAKEFGTLINACGRYDQAEIGYRVCRGDREEALGEALALLRGHRETLVKSLDFIAEVGITPLMSIQYFHAQDRIRDTVVGIAASMALHTAGANLDLPIIAFALADDGVKVSGRGTRELTARGLDLAAVMSIASKAVGGAGRGHKVAAGATIPTGKEEDFLEI